MNTFFLFALMMFGGLTGGWSVAMITSLFSKKVATHNPILPALAGLGLATTLLLNSEYASDPNWFVLALLGGVAGLLGWVFFGVGEATQPITPEETSEKLNHEEHR